MHENLSKVKLPLVSVIMPAYNSGQTIEDSIRSVQQQTYPNWELLIVDDCSTEDIKKIVDAFPDERIHYYRLSENQGVAVARNKGIEQANGQFLAFLDSDDLWHPRKLFNQVSFMQKNQYAFTYTWYRHFSNNIENLGNLVRTKPVVDYKELLKGNDIGCLTVMIDRVQVPEIKMPVQRHEDYITWLNILKTGIKAYSLPKELAYYREEKTSLTGNKWKSMMWTWQVYRKTQKLPLMLAVYYMIFYVVAGVKKHF